MAAATKGQRMVQALKRLIADAVRPQLAAMEARLMSAAKDIKDAEDRIGMGIERATAQNAANLQKLSDAINAGADTDELKALAAEAKDHADKLDAAFPPTAADPAAGATA